MAEFLNVTFARRPQRDLTLDLRVPEGVRQPPLVVIIPMRGMFRCEKSSASWWLLEHGFAVAAIECRVASEAIAPAAVHDCKAAIRWLRAHAEHYSFNPHHIGVWGFSAGGLLASLMATSGNVLPLEWDGDCRDVSSSVQAACDQAGSPHDLAYFARPDVAARYPQVAENLATWLGGPVHERRDLARLVSPTTYLSTRCPPLLLLHGDADAMTPLEETTEFYNRTQEFSIDACLKILRGVGHRRVEPMIREDLVGFFSRVLL